MMKSEKEGVKKAVNKLNVKGELEIILRNK